MRKKVYSDILPSQLRTIADYLLDHAGGNHSAKTLEWHRTAIGLLQTYLEEECQITPVEDIDAPELNGCLAHLHTTPGSRGKPRVERTIQTYTRSARAFFHWLVRRELIARNPFDVPRPGMVIERSSYHTPFIYA
jgi:integrase/recombinase XerD